MEVPCSSSVCRKKDRFVVALRRFIFFAAPRLSCAAFVLSLGVVDSTAAKSTLSSSSNNSDNYGCVERMVLTFNG